MVIGVGVDLVSVRRLAQALRRHPALSARLFVAEELGDGCSDAEERSLAARFAAKEAARKAVGAAARRTGWRDAVILGGRGGPPRMELRGALRDAALALGATAWHVSLSHERDYAIAVVVIER